MRSVKINEIEPEIILVIGVVEYESDRFLVVHCDSVQTYPAGSRDRHRQAIHGPRLIIRLNLMLQRDAKGQPLFVHILHLHPTMGCSGCSRINAFKRSTADRVSFIA